MSGCVCAHVHVCDQVCVCACACANSVCCTLCMYYISSPEHLHVHVSRMKIHVPFMYM